MSRQERRPSQVAATSARSVAVGAARIATWWPGMLAALAAYVAAALPLALGGVGYPQLLGATLSVSRPLVDAGWMPSSRQVGQSGKTVKPKVYLAMGISGAVQHLAGMKSAGTIIAVNTDPEAAIFRVAHFGAALDVFALAEELERQWP